ncbi:transketolase, partial [Austwickia sp. TVS 96-490-7B]|uniref:transketolase n=1 Tax=Austwickia sp. TVS 96-490-7B TaxID=2830843 RepID=UPI001C56E874
MTTPPATPDVTDHDVIRYARVLPLDIVHALGHGHAGTACSLTPLLTTLFQHHLRHDPADPTWPGRDRFVLSAGHTSLSLYLQLYLSGYGLDLDDLRATRTLDSLTPGHPEHGHTPGVETTTGPLGQGLGNAVGMALDARHWRDTLDPHAPPGTSPFDHRIWCLVSDGDLMEGISHEVAALAGHLRLGRLIVLWDDNRITIEGSTQLVSSEDVTARFAAYGFRIITVDDAENLDILHTALTDATVPSADHPPTFVRIRTRIGHPMPTLSGTGAAHAGAPDTDEIRATKTLLGLNPDHHFAMPAEALNHARDVQRRGAQLHATWEQRYQDWRRRTDPDLVARYDRIRRRTLPADLWDGLDNPTGPEATRTASARILRHLGHRLPELYGGSADLADTAGGRMTSDDELIPSRHSPATLGRRGSRHGRQIHYGIREHGMTAIANGIALGGLARPYVNGYLVFSDYARPAIRMSALMGLPLLHLLSHDSIAVGEDGPTHQPVEHLAALRAIPRLDVIRPADTDEMRGAWERALTSDDHPTAIISARQATPQLRDITPATTPPLD